MATNPNKQDSYLTLHAKRMEKEIGSIFELAMLRVLKNTVVEYLSISLCLTFCLSSEKS